MICFEFFCDLALGKVIEKTGLQTPLEQRSPYYVLFECTHENEEDETIILNCFEHCLDSGFALDGIMSQDQDRRGRTASPRQNTSQPSERPDDHRSHHETDASITPKNLAHLGSPFAHTSATFLRLALIWHPK